MRGARTRHAIKLKGRDARRKVGATIAGSKLAPEPERHPPAQTFSAHGEDVVAISYLLALGLKYEEIRYLDVGAAEPSRLSNTFLLYMRGAKGVLVEPDPHSAEVLRQERPRDTVVEAGVSFGGKKSAKYFRFNSSVFNTFSASQAKRVQEQSLSWGAGKEVKLIETLKIPLIPLNDIVEEYLDGQAPHFLSVDAEGVDWEILTSLDFKKYLPHVICFEGNPEQRMTDKNVLTKLGFTPLCRTPDNFIYARGTGLY